MYKSYLPYLQHILDECLYVHSVITEEMRIEQFLRDETLKRAVTRSLSIIGEATKRFPPMSNMHGKASHGARWPACETGSSMITWE